MIKLNKKYISLLYIFTTIILNNNLSFGSQKDAKVQADKIVSATDAVKKIIADSKRYQEQIAKLQADLDAARSSQSEASARVQQLQTAQQTASAESKKASDEAAKRIAALEKQIEELKKALEEARAAQTLATNQIKAAQEAQKVALAEAKKVSDDSAQKIAELEKQIADLKAQLKQSEDALKAWSEITGAVSALEDATKQVTTPALQKK